MKYSLCNDLLNPHKIYHAFFENFNDFMIGERNFLPWSLEIHPTAKCNHKCIHCSYKERNEHRMSLDKDIMDKLIESIIKMKIKGVYFSGGGEPTMYPNLKQYVNNLYINGVEVSLLTNGTILEETGIIDIADNFNYIAISVPSCNEDTFEEITGTRFLNKVLSAPMKIKNKFKEKSPIIGARVVVTNLIYKEVESILITLKEKGFDYALFKVVRDYEDRGLGLDNEAESYLKNIINNIEDKNILDHKFTNLDKIFEFRENKEFKGSCYINEMGLIANINTDGKVYPNIVEIGDEEFCVGDLNDNALEEIWNSEQHKGVKKLSKEKWIKQECKNCRAISYNHIINEILDKVPKELDGFI